MTDELYLEYNAAIGALMTARKQYADACEHHGAHSWAAEQAQEYLNREMKHRDLVRERYDAAARTRPSGDRGG